ncbi:hypothetical protein EPA93_05010 [Ktedonosporobacter rubrisoli]|uniref:Polymerase beta nucleotidyltransferase domain-containing protein n=1 Tax=Ktedonosporobacter rubrisoli TaxID=2509675 RepID=A0A4P6JJT6_KTERU|nr:nucleotidyltransferase domain-containing protein [Ktedonosporobacter rubrisoli]QBD75395.1 hypothetical protein EPA93_05010 [Ktedonosporobacter rubrisoli]
MPKSLQELYATTLQVFTQRPEVQKIYLFGSMEQHKHDAYSDLDLHVVSSDFDMTMRDLASIMNTIGEPFVWYPFHPQPGNTGYAILFRDYPLFNRLDITILDPVTPPVMPLGTCIYSNPQECPRCPSTYQAPQMAEKVRQLYGYGIGAVRYTKYRKRGKPFSAYKFYRAQCDYYFLRRYDQEVGESEVRPDIFMLLDRLPDSSLLQKYLYPGTEQRMNELYLELLGVMLRDECSMLSAEQSEALTEIIAFVRNELTPSG